MALKSCFAVLRSTLFHAKSGFSHASSSKTLFISISLPNSSLPTQNCNPRSCTGDEFREDRHLLGCLSKRKLNLVVVTTLLWGILPNTRDALLAEEMELERYTDLKEGFTLLRPSSWTKVNYPFFNERSVS